MIELLDKGEAKKNTGKIIRLNLSLSRGLYLARRREKELMPVDEEIINSSVSKPSREYSRSIQGRVKGSLSLSLPRSFVVPLIAHKKMSLCLEPQCEPAFLFDRTSLTCTLRLFRMKLARPATFCRPRIFYVSRVSLPGDGPKPNRPRFYPPRLSFPALRLRDLKTSKLPSSDQPC